MDLEHKSIKVILKENNLYIKKSLGQNFLLNNGIARKIAQRSLYNNNCGVIEIGPGLGSLTKELASLFKKVVAIELDSKLIDILKKNLKYILTLKSKSLTTTF